MRLLLDTHAWSWAHGQPDRPPAAARAAIRSPDTLLYLSPISIYEALLLAERGRITLDRPSAEWLVAALSALPLEIVDVSVNSAVMARTLEGYVNPDPFDRFLLATAVVADLSIATKHERMRMWGRVPVIW